MIVYIRLNKNKIERISGHIYKIHRMIIKEVKHEWYEVWGKRYKVLI